MLPACSTWARISQLLMPPYRNICKVDIGSMSTTGVLRHFLRDISTACSLASRSTQEISIPVPYGHLAAKAWPAATNERPNSCLLCLHGVQDNAGSFDPLLEMLDGRWHVVALDFTGHGLSSHLPRGSMYSLTQFVLDVARAVKFLGWDQFCLFGHSMGGLVAHRYANLFPEKVTKMILLDGFGDIYEPKSQVLDVSRTTLTSLLRLEDKEHSRQPRYTEKEIVNLYARAPSARIRAEDVKILMKRGCQLQADGRYVFTRDVRLKALLWDRVDSTALVPWWKSFRGDLLVLDAVPGFGRCSVNNRRMISILREHCRSFKMLNLDGDHHVHMNHPELVASHIKPFLEGSHVS
uniref:Putative kraken n=1 Tax=Amblyomma cajennense TaxID=34607 RepID=A0A023FMH3_AMBCJ